MVMVSPLAFSVQWGRFMIGLWTVLGGDFCFFPEITKIRPRFLTTRPSVRFSSLIMFSMSSCCVILAMFFSPLGGDIDKVDASLLGGWELA